jgi:MYXO-CTERM domain-containing protein
MRLAPLASGFAAVTLLLASARADLGPPPTCEKGKHHEYLYGHRCVPDGSHAEPDPAGGVRFVPDEKPAVPTSASASAAAVPSTGAPAPSASSAPAPPASKTGCSFGGVESGGAAVVAAMIGVLGMVRRRRR